MKVGLPIPGETEMFLKKVEEFRKMPKEMSKGYTKDEIRCTLRGEGPMSAKGIRMDVEMGVDEEDFSEILKEMVEDGELEIRYNHRFRLYYFKE